MQDITEESEHDLQSVFNKISESLKTINEKTMEIEPMEGTSSMEDKIPNEIQREEKITDTSSDSVPEISLDEDQVKLPDKNEKDILEIPDVINTVQELIQETTFEISNLLSDKCNNENTTDSKAESCHKEGSKTEEINNTNNALFSMENNDKEHSKDFFAKDISENLTEGEEEKIENLVASVDTVVDSLKNVIEIALESSVNELNTASLIEKEDKNICEDDNTEELKSSSNIIQLVTETVTDEDEIIKASIEDDNDKIIIDESNENIDEAIESNESTIKDESVVKTKLLDDNSKDKNITNEEIISIDIDAEDENIKNESTTKPSNDNSKDKNITNKEIISIDIDAEDETIKNESTTKTLDENLKVKNIANEEDVSIDIDAEDENIKNESTTKPSNDNSKDKNITNKEIISIDIDAEDENIKNELKTKTLDDNLKVKNIDNEEVTSIDVDAEDENIKNVSTPKPLDDNLKVKNIANKEGISLDVDAENENAHSLDKNSTSNTILETVKIQEKYNICNSEQKSEETSAELPENNDTNKALEENKSENLEIQKEKESLQKKDDLMLVEPSNVESMIIDLDDSDEDSNEINKESIGETKKNDVVNIENDDKIESTKLDLNVDVGDIAEIKNKILEKITTEIGSVDSNKQNKNSDFVIDLDDEDSNEENLSKSTENNKKLPNELVEETKNINENFEDVIMSSPKKLANLESEQLAADKNKSEDVETNEKKDNETSQNLDEQMEGSSEALNVPTLKTENEEKKRNEPEIEMELDVLEKKEETTEKHIFYNKECVNYECKKECEMYYISPIFVLNFYRVTIKQNSSQYVCDDCYDAVVNKYEEWCNLLETQQPILLTKIPEKTNEFVEILDSSDEDDGDGKKNSTVGDFDEGTINMIQKELDDVISSVLSRNEIQNQLTWSKTLLEHRISKIKEDSDWIDKTLSSLQKNADKMNTALYQCPKIEMKILAPIDLNSGKPYVLGESTQANQLTIPPIGEIYRPPIVIYGEYYSAKNKVIASWLPCKVIEIVEPPSSEKQRNIKYYKVKFFKMKLPTYKSVPAKHLAFVDVPKVQLSIGTRVIALFDASTLYRTKEIHGSDIRSAFYPGVIAEALQPYNNYRYLIFFDDGYTQYVHHRDVRLICEVSANVWDDIHPGSRDFIQNYLINYKKNRPMVQVKKGQSMVTELNGKWIYAKVVDVDASLIQMLFEGQKNHTEWIYRGSTRLGPLFKAIQKTNIPQVTRLPRRSEPFVRYMQDDENAKQNQQPNQPNESAHTSTQVRSQVARKSTSRQESFNELSIPTAAVKHLNNSTIFVDDEEPKGTLIYYSSKSENNPPPITYLPHMCSSNCIVREHFEGHYGVLSKPLLNSWERAIYKIKNKKTTVIYRAPCGRNLRSIEEVHKYLRLTRNELNVENFVFDPEVGCLNEYQVKKCIVNKADITEGREKIPIQCVNYYDHTMPPDCEYSADRIPTEGVNLNVDAEFLVGCDCKDDCNDKSKCSCWQLTLEGARYGNPHTPIENIGYHYKRLLEPVSTGIYECNSRCKCSKKCINRVVQHPLETKLQVFKTSNRGWGLRCINDVPKGAFICIYAGNLLTEQRANECGDGDEYFAELDYIEVAERLKEGYESDAQEDIESDEYVPEHDSDEEFNPRASEKSSTGLVNTRNRTATAKRSNSNTTNGTNDDDDEQERQTINFVPNTQLENYEDITTKYKSMRRLFGKNEYCYIMDAKSIGNVGRYFNHSCSPNLFVQNVFVDTHDLRFPWVAFFALTNIRAGTELTWNYNYEVGVVPGKVLFCQCGAANCRGRLL